MTNNKDLEEANKEVERSKVILHDSQQPNSKKDQKSEDSSEDKNDTTEEGSGIFTADGKELPNIEGGYDLIDPGGNLGDDELTSV